MGRGVKKIEWSLADFRVIINGIKQQKGRRNDFDWVIFQGNAFASVLQFAIRRFTVSQAEQGQVFQLVLSN